MVTITLDPTSVSDLEVAENVIAALRQRVTGVVSPPDAETSAPAETTVDIAALWSQLGPSSKELLGTAAHQYRADEWFGFEDLGRHMGRDLSAVKAIHRNLSRGLKARGMSVYDILPARWGGQRQQYRLPSPIHEAIRGL